MIGEPIKQGTLIQRLEIDFSEETKEFLLKALQAEPVKQGEWVLGDGYYCSSCGYKLQTTAIFRFCPNCGAKMDKE